MKKVAALMFALLALHHAQAYQEPLPTKLPGETLQQFGARIIPPDMKLAHTVVAGDFGPAKGCVVVLFQESEHREFAGWVLAPEDKGYKKFVLPKVRLPVSTKIRAVFFDNADNDPGKELLILCEHISGAGRYPGNVAPFWNTYVYDWNGSGFTWLEEVTKSLDAVGKTSTVRSVRRLLKKQGY